MGKRKCKINWFANKCKRSCCVKACPTEEPKKVQKPDSSEKVTCAQKKKKDQKKKCKKSWFKDACVVSCCKANSDDSEKEKNKPECEIFTDSSKKVTKPGTKKKVIVNKRKRKIRRRSAKKTILETYVLIHVAILVYLLLYQTLSVMHKNLIK